MPNICPQMLYFHSILVWFCFDLSLIRFLLFWCYVDLILIWCWFDFIWLIDRFILAHVFMFVLGRVFKKYLYIPVLLCSHSRFSVEPKCEKLDVSSKIGQNGRPGRREPPRSISFDETNRIKSVWGQCRMENNHQTNFRNPLKLPKTAVPDDGKPPEH